MNTSAIQQAIKLYKHPQEMQWVSSSETPLSDGITDLLRLCASEKKLKEFIEKIHIEEHIFNQVLYNYIEKVLLNDANTNEKKLGLHLEDEKEKRKLHYKLLMKIFHPDRNSSDNAVQITSKITQSYQLLKANKNESIFKGENIEVNYHRTPQTTINPRTTSQSFYKATEQAQQQISFTKNAFYAVSSMALLVMIILAFNLYQTNKPELIISNNEAIIELPSSVSIDNNFKLATLANIDDKILPEFQLEKLLQSLEVAYEKGDVAKIKPILENTPNIRNQSDAEIKAKLVSLFKITNDRKMLLFNFDWKNISGSYQGEGKFLSRYMMMGDDQWLTREGIALIVAEIDDKKNLKIISLQLKDNTIEQ